MQLSETCIRRPVFTIVLSLILITIGAIFFTKLDIRDTPDINPPVIMVTSTYEGADALYMEKQITTRIEKALKTIKNLRDISSTSSVGTSHIRLRFNLDADIEIALNDVRSRLSEINDIFPDDMRAPSATKADSDNFPSLWISINSDRHDSLELTRITEEQIKPVLEKLPTVGTAQLYGARYYTMRIEPDVSKLYQHNISPVEIEAAIRAQNKDYPAGKIKTDSREFSLRLNASLNDIKEFENIIIKRYDNGTLLKLKDLAKVELEPFEQDVILRYKGKRSMAIGVIKQSTANIIELSDSVLAEIEKIRKTLPAGVSMEVAYDGATAVNASIKSVFITIFEAIILVGLVTYVFLGSMRITIIPLATIPISLIATFSVMYLAGFSINTFTLLAMILAIGLVVDDAIVMMENIFRHTRELGKHPIKAAYDAVGEIGFAIVAMTITLASVFLPIGFIEGFLGKLFTEFAWTLAFCVLFSGFVALTLTPMMTSRIITSEETKKLFLLKWFDLMLDSVQNSYTRLLGVAMKHKLIFYAICLSSIAVLVFAFKGTGKGFIPPEDDGFVQIIYTGPEGSSLIESERTVIKTEPILESIPEVHGFFQVIGWGGGDRAFAFVPFIDWKKRERSASELMQEMNVKFSAIPGMSIFAFKPPSLGSGRGGSGKIVDFDLLSPWNYEILEKNANILVSRMKGTSVFTNVESNFKSSTPTIDIVVNREKAYLYNVNLDNLGRTIQYLIAGRQVGDFRMGNEIYDVIIRFSEEDRNSAASLNKISIKSSNNTSIPIDVIADIVERITVKAYDHYNIFKSIGISADLAEGVNLQEAVQELDKITSDIVDNESTRIAYQGQIKDMKESDKGTFITFIFALIFIFLVLSAQFESFADSLLILMAVPFSITGGVLSLYLFDNTINMYSNIGLVTLIGLVTKNSIMIVEFTNQLREAGKTINEAIIEAAKLRLRPILMTSIATICGALPLVFSHGAGAASRTSIGLVIVGGMIVGTIFTIFVIPVLYQTFKKEGKIQR